MLRAAADWHLWRDRHGLVAVEFALVLPILLLFTLGVAEIGRFALLGLKLQHAADTMADLASRETSLNPASLRRMFDAARYIVQPFDLMRRGVVIVSGVGVDNGGPPTVLWQESGAGGLAATSAIGSAGGRATLPADLIVRDEDTVIVAEICFRYQGWLMRIIPDIVLRRAAFYRPRLGRLRSLS